MSEEMIGYLTTNEGERGFRIVGKCCAAKRVHYTAKVYRINVNPYKAVCVECGRTLHYTATECQLFDGT